jgi:hypothetical protein
MTTRHFTSPWDAAQEAGRSRIFGGIHFPFDNEFGLKLGQLVGELIVTSWLQSLSQTNRIGRTELKVTPAIFHFSVFRVGFSVLGGISLRTLAHLPLNQPSHLIE